MKKLFFALLMLLTINGIFTTAKAQCPLTEAVDFTATDLEGVEYNLFDILDNQNKYVLIDFFFTTCPPCQATAPKVSEAYEYFGCNGFDVVFLGIDNGNSNAQCEAFDEQFGAIYPTISGIEGGGTAICQNYGIISYPTIILIAPDHSIIEQDMWPIPTAQTIINKLTGYGIQEHLCNESVETIEDLAPFEVWPNPSTGIFNIQTKDNTTQTLQVYDIAGKMVYESHLSANQQQINLSHLQKGMYILHVSNASHQYKKRVMIQ